MPSQQSFSREPLRKASSFSNDGGSRRRHERGAPPAKNGQNHQGVGMSVRVIVRKRPVSTRGDERDILSVTAPHVLVHEDKVKVDLTKYVHDHCFGYDDAFGELDDTTEVFERSLLELVDNVFVGGSSTAFCFGQTASGKTFTLFGEGGGLNFHSAPPMAGSDAYLDRKELDDMYGPDRTAGAATTASTQEAKGGVYLLAASGIYRQVAIDNAMESLNFDGHDNVTAHEGGRSPETTTMTTVTLSMYEIKGQRLYDLLNGKEELRALEDEAGVLQLVGLTEHACPTFEDFVNVSNVGRTARTTASTGANDTSSRSHCAMLVKVYGGNGQLKGSLSLIDLAGSERGVDNDNTDKLTRKEGRDINTSLLALKEVIRAMQSGTHAPFRQSRLTQVLEDSLTGARCKTVVVACVSGAAHNVQHTLNTLRYAADLRPNPGKEERAGAAALLSAAAASRHSFDGPSGLQAGNNLSMNLNGNSSRSGSASNSNSSGPGLRVGAGPSLRKPNATGVKPERRGNNSSSAGSTGDVLRLAPVRSLENHDQAELPQWASDRMGSQSESRPAGRNSGSSGGGGVLPENRESASLQRPSRRGSLKPLRNTSASPSPRPKPSHFKCSSDAKSPHSNNASSSSSSSSHPQSAGSTTTPAPATEKAPKSSSYWPRSFSRSKRPTRSSSADASKQSNSSNTSSADAPKGAAPAVAVAAASTAAAAGAPSEHSYPQASLDSAPPPPPPASQVLSDDFSLNLDSPVRQGLPGNPQQDSSGGSGSGSGHRGTFSNMSMESGDSAMLYDPSMSTPRHHHQMVDADDVSVVDYGDPFFPTNNPATSSPTSTSSAGSPLIKRPPHQSKNKSMHSGSDQLRGVNQSLDGPLHDSGGFVAVYEVGKNSWSGSSNTNEDGERSVPAPSAGLFRPRGRSGEAGEKVSAAEAALGVEVALRFGVAASSSRVWKCLRELGVETEADLKHVHEDEVAATAKLVGVKTVQLNKLKEWVREVQQVAELPLSLDAPTVAAADSAPTVASSTSTTGAGADAGTLAAGSTGNSNETNIGGSAGASPSLPGLFTGDNQAMLEAIGFGWDGLSFDLYWRRAHAHGIYSPKDWPHPSKNPFLTLLSIAQYMATPGSSTPSSSADLPKSGSVPQESSATASSTSSSSSFEALEALVNESMPAPAVLAAFDKQWCLSSRAGWGGCCGVANILGLASRAFLRLGRRSEAEDTAWLALQPNGSHGKGGAANANARVTGASATANAGASVTTATTTDAKPDPLPVDLTASAGGATRKAGSSSRRSNSSPPANVHVHDHARVDKRGNELQHRHPKVATRVTCRCVLGDIAASEAKWLVAEGYFAEALADARACESPALEVTVCSKWRCKVLQPAGKSQAGVDSAIDDACKRMGCNRGDVSELLRPEP